MELNQLVTAGSSNQGAADAMVIIMCAVEKYGCSMFDQLGIPSSAIGSRRVLPVLLFLQS